MAYAPAVVFLLCALTIVKAERNHSNVIKLGSSLSPNSNLSSWLSPSGHFGFGFYPQGNGFAVGIQLVNDLSLTKAEQSIVVWTAQRDGPLVSSNSMLLLTRDGLLLQTEQGKQVPITENLSKEARSAAMLDYGNFVVYDHRSQVIWQSFDSPTDTILGGQNLTSGMYLVSSVSSNNHSSGRYWLQMQTDGNLVSYQINITTPEASYWSSNTHGDMTLSLEVRGFLVLLPETGTGSAHPLANGSYDPRNNRTIIYRATLEAEGIFRLYLHNYSVMSRSSKVLIVWSNLDDQCEVKGVCGFNSYCALIFGKTNKTECHCYPGFNPNDEFPGCYKNGGYDGCTGNEDQRLRYNMASIDHMSWPGDHPYSVVRLEKLQVCSDSCLKDCSCKAVLYINGSCNKYKLPLRYGRTSPGISATGFIKVAETHNLQPLVKNETKNSRGLIVILALSLGSIACICFAFAVSSFTIYVYRLKRYKKLLDHTKVGLAEELFSLQSFSYSELEDVTHGFKDELGRGTFGAVYKGTLSTSNKVVAVKRLEKVVEEGVREFKAEITTIGRTHHRNLVQLLGFCIEGSRKLLVYEYMSNGSLARLLFNKAVPVRPSWRERVGIVLDVAKAVLYLHEECGVHIIHCNLKPQNILLDHTWTAKISDFGLARLLVPNDETKISIGGEQRSTYLAPEWQKNALISVKSDIYSFGIVLLETVCCRKNIELKVSAPDEMILSSWAYKCFKAREVYKLVEDDDQNVDLKTLERMIKVGLWCVQDDPGLRPLMKNVILMLEGTTGIPVPPSPELPKPVDF
ncbi:PREDICTED: G-type lectin S-receptor-like serine/threonine-protein kinase RLK1 [Prunus mume]|uniref:Receptor-like serine/threonine-protein kinase n=1 Tax=Prunus mume TaxID=102107 RepID=A0ABM0PUZ0_PRUMU|nr:PREDICTED: G-type lectin S-receptor-like serine/threonine-protein kinase RLK1 [Prunus mume]